MSRKVPFLILRAGLWDLWAGAEALGAPLGCAFQAFGCLGFFPTFRLRLGQLRSFLLAGAKERQKPFVFGLERLDFRPKSPKTLLKCIKMSLKCPENHAEDGLAGLGHVYCHLSERQRRPTACLAERLWLLTSKHPCEAIPCRYDRPIEPI